MTVVNYTFGTACSDCDEKDKEIERLKKRQTELHETMTVLHELDECLYVDGRRPFDAHACPPLPQWGT